jgi:nitrite reductase (NO-forming)
MPDWLIRRLREWYIVGIGVILIVGGLVLATELSSPPVHEHASVESGAPSSAETDSQSAAGNSKAAKPAEQAAKSAPATKDIPQKSAKQTQPAAKDVKGAEPAKETKTAQAPAAKSQPAPKVEAPQAAKPAPAAKAAPENLHGGHAAHAAAPAAVSGGDVALGQQAFRKCQACHSIEAGKNLIGPSLADVVGRPAAQVDGYNYSPAMKDSKVVWDAAALDAFLEAPQKFIPKNKMAFPGLRSETERRNVTAYLASTGAGAAPAVAQQQPTPSTAQQKGPAAKGPAPAQKGAPSAVAQRPDPSAARPSPQPGAAAIDTSIAYVPDVRITLRSGIADGRMVYLGVGGGIEGQVNPVLSAAQGQIVQITLLNGEGAEHDIVIPDQNAASPRITGRNTSTVLVSRATKIGDFVYYCDVPGHRLAGMEGKFLVTPRPPDQVMVEADISQQPTEVPPPIGDREPQTIRVDLVAVELEARLAEGTTYGFWTFNGRVPGPMLRARVGDTLDVHLRNSDDSAFIHSVDFHAATGPGGGAAATQVDPGHLKSFKFKALVPGLYVYHCATPMVAHHITNGMYGMILIEPEGGLPKVDKEFYVMQGEIYTQEAFGQQGRQEFSVEKLLNERAEYFVFNGSVGALSSLHPLKAKVGETVRIYFGVGGPNYTSSFHVIGEIFDRVYSFADVLSQPLRGVQTITVPPGGAAIVEFKLDVPGNYILVDHALSRAERGLVGILQAEGAPNPQIFEGKVEEGSGH